MKKIFIALMSFFFIVPSVLAECSYTEQVELNNKAANIKVDYEVVDNKIDTFDGSYLETYFNIMIYNVTEDFYVIAKYNNIEKTYYYSDSKDSVITIRWDNIKEITQFEFEIHASSNTSCSGNKIKSLYFTSPRQNEYSLIKTCEELENFYMCKRFVTFNEVDNYDFYKQLDNYRSGLINDSGEPIKEKTFSEKLFEFLKNNKWYIIGGIALIGISAGSVYYMKTKKRRELGL